MAANLAATNFFECPRKAQNLLKRQIEQTEEKKGNELVPKQSKICKPRKCELFHPTK